MSTPAQQTVVNLDEPTDAWRWQCPRRHANWSIADRRVYCRTCRARNLGEAHTKLWDAAECRMVPLNDLELKTEKREWKA